MKKTLIFLIFLLSITGCAKTTQVQNKPLVNKATPAKTSQNTVSKTSPSKPQTQQIPIPEEKKPSIDKDLVKKCDERVVEQSDYYGERTVWPLVEEKYPTQKLTNLGTLFAAMDCGEDYVKKEFPEGVNTHGIYATIWPEPSKRFEDALKEVGFEFVKEGPRYKYENGKTVPVENSQHEKWRLIDQVEIQKLKKLKEFVNEKWSTDHGALRSQLK